MEIKEPPKRPGLNQNKKLVNAYNQFNGLLAELKKRELPSEIVTSINGEIEQISHTTESDKEFGKQIRKAQSGILKLLEKELKLVTKNHYRKVWMAIGVGAFGVPFGVAFGTSLQNMAFIGAGLPIGVAIGMAVGSGKDKKAFEEGRQLDLEIK